MATNWRLSSSSILPGARWGESNDDFIYFTARKNSMGRGGFLFFYFYFCLCWSIFCVYTKSDVNLLSWITLIKLPLILAAVQPQNFYVLWGVNSCVIDANAVFLTHNNYKTTILRLGLFCSRKINLWWAGGISHCTLWVPPPCPCIKKWVYIFICNQAVVYMLYFTLVFVIYDYKRQRKI